MGNHGCLADRTSAWRNVVGSIQGRVIPKHVKIRCYSAWSSALLTKTTTGRPGVGIMCFSGMYMFNCGVVSQRASTTKPVCDATSTSLNTQTCMGVAIWMRRKTQFRLTSSNHYHSAFSSLSPRWNRNCDVDLHKHTKLHPQLSRFYTLDLFSTIASFRNWRHHLHIFYLQLSWELERNKIGALESGSKRNAEAITSGVFIMIEWRKESRLLPDCRNIALI